MSIVSEKQREDIIINQLVVSNVSDEVIIDIISKIPRTLFLSPDIAHIGNSDSPIEYKKNRYLLDMPTMANMLQIAKFQETDVVLVLGSGLGYGASLISKLVSRVICIEKDENLVEISRNNLNKLEITNVELCNGSLESVALIHPFNRVFVEGAFSSITNEIQQLLNRKTDLIGIERKNNLSKIIKAQMIDGKIIVNYGKNTATPYLKGFEEKEKFSF